MYKFKLQNMFCDDAERLEKQCSENYLIEESAKVIEVEKGIILPFKNNRASGWNKDGDGGVCDSFGNFVAGHLTHSTDTNFKGNRKCQNSYRNYDLLIKRSETVVYGGFLINQFGHFITESISRLWYYVQNPNIKFKFIFLNFDNNPNIYFTNILESIGLSFDQCELITTPTQFYKVIVPDQSLYFANGFRMECKLIYDHLILKSTPSLHKKIYLSKTQYGDNSGLQEKYFENFYKSRGFEIIYPENFSFLEQVGILNAAEEVVCTMGTIQHLTFFCTNNAKVTVLNRAYGIYINNLGVFSLQLRNLETFFVDISFTFLPLRTGMPHIGGKYLWGPTKHWINYLDAQNIAYKLDEVSFDLHVKPFIYDYLIQWAKHYNETPAIYQHIKNRTIADVISTIYQSFLGETLDTTKFPERDDVVKMQNQIKGLTATIEDQIKLADLKENITQDEIKVCLLDVHEKLAQQIENKSNIVRNLVTNIDNQNQSVNMELKYKCDKLEKSVVLLEEKIEQMVKQNMVIIDKMVDDNKLVYKKIDNILQTRTCEYNKSNGQLRWARSEIDKIRCSKSYKIGLAITWFPRKIISFFKK